MTTDRKTTLYATILAGEDAESTRAVYADLLEENGDVARANFIRAQLEVAQHPAWDARAVVARWEMRALELAHGARWRAELPALDGVEWFEFEGGFCTTVRVTDVPTLHQHAAAIVAAAPVVRVVLATAAEPTPAPAGGWPWLQILRVPGDRVPTFHPTRSILSLAPELEIHRADEYNPLDWIDQRADVVPLRRLEVRGEHVAGAVVVGRIAKPHIAAHLQRLAVGTKFDDRDTGYFDDPTLREAGALQLAGAQFAQVEALDIDRQRVTGVGLARLLESMPRLRELAARDCAVTNVDFLLASVGAPIVSLGFGMNEIGSKGAAIVVQAPRCATLASLALDGCELGSHGVEAIVASPCWHTLRELDLSQNPLGLAGAIALAGAPRPAHLHTLRLADCDLTEEATRLLAGIPWLDALLVVDLSKNEVAPTLLGAIGNVRDVRLVDCNLVGTAVTGITALWRNAVRIDLSGNAIGAVGLAALVGRGTSAVQRLALDGCGLDDAAIAALARATCPHLHGLSLAGNPVSTAAVRMLVTSPMFARVRHLELSRCKLTDDVVPILVAHCAGLDTLDLRQAAFTDAGIFALADAVPELRIKQLLLNGDPWHLPVPKREYLESRFGPGWWWHPEDEELET